MGSRDDQPAAPGENVLRPAAAQPVAQNDDVGCGSVFDAVDRGLQLAAELVGFVVQTLLEHLDVDDLRELLREMSGLDFENRTGDDGNSILPHNLRYGFN